MRERSFEDKARAAWGPMPDWVEALALACDRGSARQVARLLGVSAAYVSWAIHGDRPQYHEPVRAAVRSRLMGETIACPVLGEIAPDRCRELRADRSRPLGPIQRRLRETCPDCLHNTNRMEETGDDIE